MTKTERIWLGVAFLALAALIIWEVRKAALNSAAAQAQFGTPQSTNPLPSGQIAGPGQGQDAIAAGVGPWYLYYNTPGAYNFLPPVVNTVAPPNLNASDGTANANITGCDTCH